MKKTMQEELFQFPVVIEQRVQWGDMDVAKHVNNVVYLRWSESARIKYFEKIEMETSFSNSVGPILAWQDCKYIFPMTYPDTALIAVKLDQIAEDRFFMLTHIYSKQHQRLAIISKQAIVPYDYQNLTKAEIPTHWISNMQKLAAQL